MAVYGQVYDANTMTTMAGGTEQVGPSVFTDILGDVADSALNAVLRGQSVKDAIVSTAVQGASTAIGTAIANSISNADTITNSTSGGT